MSLGVGGRAVHGDERAMVRSMSAYAQASSAFVTERLLAFVPGNVRRALLDVTLPLLSSNLAAGCAAALSGPVVEVTWPGTSALLGCLRAARRARVALALVIPDAFLVEDPGARPRIMRAVVALAEEARYDEPLFVIRRLRGQRARAPEDVERLQGAISAEVDAGFPSIALRPAELELTELKELTSVLAPFAEAGIAFELEFEGRDGAGLILATLDDAGMRFAAVRGASAEDELGGALLVVDPLEDHVPDDIPCRVSLDAFVVKGISRAVSAEARDLLLRAVRRQGASGALAGSLDTLAEIDDSERARVEALVYAEVSDAITALGAEGVGDELVDALLEGSTLAGDA